jgi:hypothetical protein
MTPGALPARPAGFFFHFDAVAGHARARAEMRSPNICPGISHARVRRPLAGVNPCENFIAINEA